MHVKPEKLLTKQYTSSYIFRKISRFQTHVPQKVQIGLIAYRALIPWDSWCVAVPFEWLFKIYITNCIAYANMRQIL